MEQRENKTDLSSFGCGICYYVYIFDEPVRYIHDRALTFSIKRKDQIIHHGFTRQDVKINAQHHVQEIKPLHIDTKQFMIEKGSRGDLDIQRDKIEFVHDLSNRADINNSWMETSTIAANRKELAK